MVKMDVAGHYLRMRQMPHPVGKQAQNEINLSLRLQSSNQ